VLNIARNPRYRSVFVISILLEVKGKQAKVYTKDKQVF
jgi:hypothetical protein